MRRIVSTRSLLRFPFCGLSVLLGLGMAMSSCSEQTQSKSTPADPGNDKTALAGSAEELTAQLERYGDSMDDLVVLLRDSDDAAQVEIAIRELIDLSLPLVDGLPEFHPECADYLTAAREVYGMLDTIGEERIEKEFHEDGALPETSSALCYHTKDLLVHPATALVLLREEGLEARRDDMLEEILENQAHLAAVRAALEAAGRE